MSDTQGSAQATAEPDAEQKAPEDVEATTPDANDATVDVNATETAEAAPEAPAAETPAEPEPPGWQDKYLRLAAEFENFRRRSAREFETIVRNGESDLIAELTEALDNLDRAIAAVGEQSTDDGNPVSAGEDLVAGVKMTRGQFWQALTKRGLARMPTTGEPFDPSRHDALMQKPSTDYDAGIIESEIAPGYMLGERVLRHAKVIVSSGAPSDTETDERTENNVEESQ